MIRLLSVDERNKLASIYDSEWSADTPGQFDAVIADVKDGELKGFVTSEAMVRIGMLWLTPRLRKTLAGGKVVVNLFRYLRRNAPEGTSVIVIADEPGFEDIAEKFGMRPVEGKLYRIDL